MAKTPFQKLTNTAPQGQQITQRDLDILIDQVAIMTRQNGDMATQLAHAEAINRRLASEYAALRQAHDALTKKGKKA